MGLLDNKISEALNDNLDVADLEIESAIADLANSSDFEDNLARRARDAVAQFAIAELGAPAPLRFVDEFDFFDDYLSPAYEVGGVGDRGWCSHWWEHPSARFRIRAMWTAYEALRHRAPATVDEEFLRTIGDHHMRVLLGDASPMIGCQVTHKPSTPLESASMASEAEGRQVAS